MGLDFATHLRWLLDVGLRGRPLTFGNLEKVTQLRGLFDLLYWTTTQVDPSVTWKDLEWVRQLWKGPLILKGVLDVADAREAAASGAQAIVVSNHGGRQLDSAPASLAVLPAIADAVGGSTELLMDGGVRSGQDIAKAIALGARACLVGRPWVYGVAAAGQAGVAAVIETLKQELRVTMALLGVSRVSQLDRSVLEA
jgi:L-lactate dehydrogenase (cytochrome)